MGTPLSSGWPARRVMIFVIAVAMALFHLYTAGIRPLPGVQQRTIHLSFALALSFLMFPLKSKRDESQEGKVANENRPLGVIDLLFVALSFFLGVYVFIEYEALSFRIGMPNFLDSFCSLLGILLVLEATRRLIGWSIVILCMIGFAYLAFGTYLPSYIAHTGFSFELVINFMFFSTEGILGLPLSVSATVLLRAVAGLLPGARRGADRRRYGRIAHRSRARAALRLPAAGPCGALAAAGARHRGARALPARRHRPVAPCAGGRRGGRARHAGDRHRGFCRPAGHRALGRRAPARCSRVLAGEAPVVLADEPTTSLDPHYQIEVMRLLHAAAGSGTLVIVVTHDLGFAARFADTVLVLDRGRLVASGPPRRGAHACRARRRVPHRGVPRRARRGAGDRAVERGVAGTALG